MRLHTKNESVLKHHLEQNIFCERVRGTSMWSSGRVPAPPASACARAARSESYSSFALELNIDVRIARYNLISILMRTDRNKYKVDK